MNSKVFVITPFSEDFLALYDELKNKFSDHYEFQNAGDLDNQQNILQDIVEGIHSADVIIADLTGLNSNVFYELGLAHAMNKKVIIITQDIGELPFDIKSYRANEYSLQFNKIPALIEKIDKLLSGAISGKTKFGNPVSDYLPDYFTPSFDKTNNNPSNITTNIVVTNDDSNDDTDNDKGFLDYIGIIQEKSQLMTKEINQISDELGATNISITSASSEISRVKEQSGTANINYIRTVCRKLADPTEKFASQLKTHTINISSYWSSIEDNYLALLDNKYSKESVNKSGFQDSMDALNEMKRSITESNQSLHYLIDSLQNSRGMERRLNKAISSLTTELESYLSLTDTMYASIDRIIAKSKLVLENGN